MKVIKKQSNSLHCFVCGVENESGLHASFYEMEDNSVIALFTFKDIHRSYPSRTHGGIISSVIDETIGRLYWVKHPYGLAVTMKLEIEYHQGVPYDVPLKCVAHMVKEMKMTFEGEAEILTMDGKMLARGHALYFPLSEDKIVGSAHDDEKWIDVPDDIEEID